MQSAAAGLGVQLEILTARTIPEVDSAFARLAERRIEALFLGPGVFFTNRRVQFATLATRYAIATMYYAREFVEAGGLMSYGSSEAGMHHQMGAYAGRILRGEKTG
jgi:putative ABC transport system substrate-binding protein